MSGGDAQTQTNTVRYAPYLETNHKSLLELTMLRAQFAAIDNPYEAYTELDFEDAFLDGYAISAYPSLYDMFGKFMAGLDVEILFDEIFEDTVNGTVVNNMISEEADRLSDDIDETAAPRLETGLRDINSVMSSSFVVARNLMEETRLKAVTRFSAEMKYRLMPVVTERWKSHLAWNDSVIAMYSQVMKFYITQKFDTDNHNLEVEAKRVMWPFNPYRYWAQAISATSGAIDTTTELTGISSTQKVVGSALSGAGAGAMMGSQIGALGGPAGMGIGAGIGALIGLL